jgi:hypothetical protein
MVNGTWGFSDLVWPNAVSHHPGTLLLDTGLQTIYEMLESPPRLNVMQRKQIERELAWTESYVQLSTFPYSGELHL